MTDVSLGTSKEVREQMQTAMLNSLTLEAMEFNAYKDKIKIEAYLFVAVFLVLATVTYLQRKRIKLAVIAWLIFTFSSSMLAVIETKNLDEKKVLADKAREVAVEKANEFIRNNMPKIEMQPPVTVNTEKLITDEQVRKLMPAESRRMQIDINCQAGIGSNVICSGVSN